MNKNALGVQYSNEPSKDSFWHLDPAYTLAPTRALVLLCSFFVGVASGAAEESLAIRPALLGTGPKSLINVLSSERLIKHGQKDGAVSFTFFVSRWGNGGGVLTYEGTPNSDVLSQELIDQIGRAKFIPAVYHGETVSALVNGTLVFAISPDGKPHLRIFLNQDRERLARGEDFISPQLLFPMNRKFKWFDFGKYRIRSGMVAAKINVDENGKLLAADVVREYPAGAGFGNSVLSRIYDADLSPPFLKGRPVTASTIWMIPFRASGLKHWAAQ